MLARAAFLALGLLSSASASAPPKLPLVCTNVTSGYLAYKYTNPLSILNTLEPLVSGPATDAGGNPYLNGDTRAEMRLWTLESCNSTFLGFPSNGTGRLYGRWTYNGTCVTAEKSDGALALKACATVDGKALLKQYFSTSADLSHKSHTQLIGGTAQNNTLMYTYWARHHRTNVPTQQAAKPPGWGRYNRYIVFYPFPLKPDPRNPMYG